MKNNLGTILGGIALVLSLANSYFIYDMSNNKTNDFSTDPTTGAVTDANGGGMGGGNVNQAAPMNNPNVQGPVQATPPAPSGPPTSISFKNMEHDFGNIKQNTENPYEFVFTNTGKNPLVISDAKGSCGCTVPEYPKDPIAPGATGKIRVVYSPGTQEGQQTKNVTITANTEPQQTVISIKANVKK